MVYSGYVEMHVLDGPYFKRSDEKNVQCRENWKDRLSLAAVSSLYTWDIGNTLRTNLLIWIFKNLDVAYSHKVEKPFFYKVWSGPGWTHSHIFYWRKGYGEIMFSIMAHNWRRQSLAGYFSKFCQFRSQLWVPKLKTWSRQIMFYVIYPELWQFSVENGNFGIY